MFDQKQTVGLISELYLLGGEAQKYYWSPPQNENEKKEQERAAAEFIEFFERIPEKLEASPSLAKTNLAANLMRIGITFSHVEDMAQVPMVAGRVLSRLDGKHPEMIGPAMAYLKYTIKSGGGWKKHSMPEANIVRDDALEIIRWAVVGVPEWGAKHDLSRIAAEAAVFPFCMDTVLADNIIFDMKKPQHPAPEKFASIYSSQARETLGTMIALNPDWTDGAMDVVDKAEKSAIRMCKKELRPVLLAAAEQTRAAIFKAADEAAQPKGNALKEAIRHSFINIMALR